MLYARGKCHAAKMEKCKNPVLFKGGVGNARRADRINRHFVGVGRSNINGGKCAPR